MTSDLTTQVRDYTEFFVSTVEPVEMDEILAYPMSHEGVQPIGPVGADRPRALWVAMVATAVILIVVGGVTWLTRPGGDVAPVEEPSASTTVLEQVSTTTATEVIPTTQPDVEIPTSPPPVGRIAFLSDRDAVLGGLDQDLVMIDADGTGRIHLAELVGGGDPVWSRDGTQIAFGTLGRDNTQVFIVDLESSEIHQVTDIAGSGMYHDWSPDGSRLAFNGNDRLYVVNADGSDPTVLSDLIVGDLAWSPDGSRIAFEVESGDVWDIYLINVDGSEAVQLTDLPGTHNLSSSPWSPDGIQISFTTAIRVEQPEESTKTEVHQYVISSDGTDLEEVQPAPFWTWSWSPDGSRVAFSDPDRALWVMNSDGSNVTRLSAELFLHLGYAGVSWSPTGTHIAISAAPTPDENTANYDIYIVAADGSEVIQVTTEPGNDIAPVWSPTPTP